MIKGSEMKIWALSFFVLAGCATTYPEAVQQYDAAQARNAEIEGDLVPLALAAENNGSIYIRLNTIRRPPGKFMAVGYQFRSNGSRSAFYQVEIDCVNTKILTADLSSPIFAKTVGTNLGNAVLKSCQSLPPNFEFAGTFGFIDDFANYSSARRTDTSSDSFEILYFRDDGPLQDFSRPKYLYKEIDCVSGRIRLSKNGPIDLEPIYQDSWEPMAAQYLAFYCEKAQGMGQIIANYVASSESVTSSSRPKTESEPSVGLESARTTCVDLGFKDGTEAFGECVLKLTD